MRIGELAKRAGVTVRALRYYEAQGLLDSRRSANGYRDFDDAAVERVSNIRMLLDSGLDSASVAEIGQCLAEDLEATPTCSAAIELFERRLATVETRVAALGEVRDELQRRLIGLRAGDVDH